MTQTTDFLPAEKRFTGRKAALIVVAFFGVIIAVNATMLTLAVNSFGGLVVGNSYVASQRFNADIATARAQPIRDWTLDLGTDAGGVALAVKDRNGTALHDLGITLTLARPTHGRETVTLDLVERAPGIYSAALDLAPGRWIATVTTANGQTRSITILHNGGAS